MASFFSGNLRHIKNLISTYYSILLLFAAWEVAAELKLVNTFLLPPLSSIAEMAFESILTGEVPYHTALTLYRSVVAFSVAAGIGVPLGICMARIKRVNWVFDPLFSIGFPTPKISFFPIFMLWFGMFDLSKIFMGAFASLFPIVNATYLATIHVDRYLIWSAQNMGTSTNKLLWKIVLPSAVPQIFNGFQIALPLAFIVVSATEMLAGGGGLGNFMMLEARFARSPSVFVGIFSLTIIGYLLIKVLEWLRRLLLVWHVETEKVT